MIETRRSARQKHAKNSVIYVKPVKPIGQTVEKNYEFLIKTSLENKESKKKMVHDSEFRQGRYNRNKIKCSEFDIL